MKIDVEHKLFYNYSPNDIIQVKDNRLYVNGTPTCVISCPAHGNMNTYLTQIGYNPPEIKYNWSYRIKMYVKSFLPEIVLIFLVASTFIYFTFPLSLAISFLLFTTFVEYELNIKHYPISLLYTFLYLCLDCFHMGIVITVMYLLFNLKCSLKKLIILDTIYLIIVLFFYYHKRCILSIYQNQLINKNVSWTGPFDRINYFIKVDKQYVKSKTGWTMNDWIEGNKRTCILIVLLNLYCLFKN